MERLTASPRIVDIYGYCATSLLSEAMHSEVWTEMIGGGNGYISQHELNAQLFGPKNTYTVREKLQLALNMTEALADLHGFQDGVIFHGDTHPEQWLKARDGTWKLNDFNNAEWMDYDMEAGSYCKIYRDFNGPYCAPEDYGGYVDEGIDTFALGNNFYCLVRSRGNKVHVCCTKPSRIFSLYYFDSIPQQLTGLWPFYTIRDDEKIQTKLKKGQRAYIDPRYRTRSYGERALIEIMERTWVHDPSQRATVFEVAAFLRTALASPLWRGAKI